MIGRVLLVDQDLSAVAPTSKALTSRGFEVRTTATLGQAVDAVELGEAQVVVIGPGLSADASVAAVCERIQAAHSDVRVVLLGEQGGYDAAIAALRSGALDFVKVPVDMDALELTLHRALRQRELSEEVARRRVALAEASGFEELVGASPPMQHLFEMLERAAETTSSVLITGESGTGKELVARALHKRSKRGAGPFVAVNCSAIPESLLESELFGHVKGAFTDAKAPRSGLFVKASGGTIFLDEIGDMPISVQPKLLRSLQERTVRPVGGDNEIPFDARVVAATNLNLEEAVAGKQFREDLFYRINVIHIEVPPLRDRASDILLVAQHYVEHFAIHLEKRVTGIGPVASEKLLSYPWPGNVRELQNCIERAVALTRTAEISADDLPEKVRNHKRSHVLVVSSSPSELVTMEEVERRYIRQVLQAVRGNKRETARILGFDRKTLYRKLDRYDIRYEPPPSSESEKDDEKRERPPGE